MACLEHICAVCKEVWFNNDQGTQCPKCGSTNYTTFYDEWLEYDDDDEDGERSDD